MIRNIEINETYLTPIYVAVTMTWDLLGQLQHYAPALANGAATVAFPFISEIRKDWIHPSKAAGTISNITSGIAAAAVLLLMHLERHSLHVIAARLPHWFWIIIAGIVLLLLQHVVIRVFRAGNLRQFGSILMFGMGIVVLTFGFNLAIASELIYLPVRGVVHCQNITSVDLKTDPRDPASSIAASPVEEESNRYQFLLRPEEKRMGLYVTAEDQDSRIVETDDGPEASLDLCDSN